MKEKVLVTGTQGFLGSNFVDFLYTQTDYTIYAISRTKMETDYNPQRFISISHDLLNPIEEPLTSQLSEMDYVVHFAGSSDVQTSLRKPLEAFQNNVTMTAQLLEFVREHMKSVRQFLFFSTAEVFGPSKGNNKFTEEDRVNPQGPYAATKSAAGDICSMYYSIYGIPTVLTFVMNVYGNNQSDNKFIPKIIKKIKNDETVILHANSGPDKRNYLHVDDISEAVLFLMLNGTAGSKYNMFQIEKQTISNLHN